MRQRHRLIERHARRGGLQPADPHHAAFRFVAERLGGVKTFAKVPFNFGVRA